jgi:hypothetical protein
MEKEVIDGAELRQLLENSSPGPRLVPGSDALGPLAPEGSRPGADVAAAHPGPGVSGLSGPV